MISKDPATEVTGRADPGVLAVLPVPASGNHTQLLTLQETEAEAGNGILFILVFVNSIMTIPEGCFEDNRKSEVCTGFVSEPMCSIAPT